MCKEGRGAAVTSSPGQAKENVEDIESAIRMLGSANRIRGGSEWPSRPGQLFGLYSSLESREEAIANRRFGTERGIPTKIESLKPTMELNGNNPSRQAIWRWTSSDHSWFPGNLFKRRITNKQDTQRLHRRRHSVSSSPYACLSHSHREAPTAHCIFFRQVLGSCASACELVTLPPELKSSSIRGPVE